MTDTSIEHTALGLTRLIVENEKEAGKPLAAADIFRIYAQCLRRANGLRQRLG
jgi:hypothetical protein